MKKRITSLMLLMAVVIGLLFVSGQSSTQGIVLGATENTCQDKVVVTATKLNVRTSKGTQSPIVDVLKLGDTVNVLGKLGNWYIIKTDNGQIGIIYKWYTKPSGGWFSWPVPKPEQPAPTPKPEPQEPAPTPKPEPTPEQPTPQPEPEPVPEQPAPEPKPEPTPQPEPEPAPEQPAPKPSEGISAEQSKMLELVNAERAKAGVKPLTWDANIAKVAYVKAKDMVDNNYFSHTSPTYGSPFDMMKNFGIQYRTAGENLAGYSSVEGAHNGLMNSDGHRKNILNPNFTHIGIGIEKSPRYGYVFVQMFVGR
jgi:uncharacterized YkwD family protein